MKLNDTVSERAKAQLDQLGWSVNATAKKIGLSTGYLNRLISGEARWNTDAIEKIASVFNVSPAWLTGAARRIGPVGPPIDPAPLIDAVQRGDPLGVARAFTQIVASIPPVPEGVEDPTRAELIAAYDRRDWRRIMQLAGQLADQWDR